MIIIQRIDLDGDNKVSINDFCDCDTNDDGEYDKGDGEYVKDDSKCICINDDDDGDDYSSVQTN